VIRFRLRSMLLWSARRYEGDFRSNKLEGHGKYTLSNGDAYEGELKQNMMHGYGICTYANGQTTHEQLRRAAAQSAR
jgi:hypothetical protein